MVLIRGNSTPYVNGLWDSLFNGNGEPQHDEQGTIREMIASLTGAKNVLLPGGFLYIDKCHEEESQVKILDYPTIESFPNNKLMTTKNGFRIQSLYWKFTTDLENYSRTWQMKSML